MDARNYQITFLGIFLLVGILSRDWTIQPAAIFALGAATLLTQKLGSYLLKSPSVGLRSAVITTLSLTLLLRSNSYLTLAIAGILGISSKFLLRYQGKHLFNPANFGIIVALLLTNDAWVSPGRWGVEGWYILLFISTAGIVLKKVGRWDTSVAFLLTYTFLSTIRNLWLGWSLDVLTHQLFNGSLLIFALFMLTDPRSIPNAATGRIIWAISLALVSFYLQTAWYLSTAIFWALFLLSPLTPVLDKIWSAPRFQWSTNENN